MFIVTSLCRYLEYLEMGDWLITDQVGHDEGFISHEGGSVCAEHAGNKWEVSVWKEETKEYVWAYDTLLKVECVKEKEEGSSEFPRASGSAANRQLSPPSGGRFYDGSLIIVLLSTLTFILFSILVLIFARKFHRAWSKGAHGKQLLLQSIDI